MNMDYEGAAEIERAWREGLTPDPLLTVSEWSDRHRMLSSKASAEPGRWRTSRTPYLKAIMDCLSPTSPVERVVFMKAAQLGATEMGSNWIGYVIHHAPGPMMAVWPTVEMAKRNSKQRIDPLIEESSALAELIAPARSRDSGNTILAKEFRGGVLSWLTQGFGDGEPMRLKVWVASESPSRLTHPDLDVLASVTRAIHQECPLGVDYYSISSGCTERVIVPFALIDNGLRWHVRAFDRKSQEFRDFVITRIKNPVVLKGLAPPETACAGIRRSSRQRRQAD